MGKCYDSKGYCSNRKKTGFMSYKSQKLWFFRGSSSLLFGRPLGGDWGGFPLIILPENEKDKRERLGEGSKLQGTHS